MIEMRVAARRAEAEHRMKLDSVRGDASLSVLGIEEADARDGARLSKCGESGVTRVNADVQERRARHLLP